MTLANAAASLGKVGALSGAPVWSQVRVLHGALDHCIAVLLSLVDPIEKVVDGAIPGIIGSVDLVAHLL